MENNETNTNPEMEFSPVQQGMIRASLNSSFHKAKEDFREQGDALVDAAENNERWQKEGFSAEVKVSRKAFFWWCFTLFCIGFGFFLNCVLVQELIQELQATLQVRAGMGKIVAQWMATLILSTVIFLLLLGVKFKSDTTEEKAELNNPKFAGLAPNLRKGFSQSVKKKIWVKNSTKLGYMLAMLLVYSALYFHLAYSQKQLLQQAGAINERLDLMTQTTLGSNNGATTLGGYQAPGDVDFASAEASTSSISSPTSSHAGTGFTSQANQFAVLYGFEWLLHLLIMYGGSALMFGPGFSTALASQRRDRKSFQRIRANYHAAAAKLFGILQPMTPDDGFNADRNNLAKAMLHDDLDTLNRLMSGQSTPDEEVAAQALAVTSGDIKESDAKARGNRDTASNALPPSADEDGSTNNSTSVITEDPYNDIY